jgi:RNA polymerase sigma factor (sigma-70 family)
MTDAEKIAQIEQIYKDEFNSLLRRAREKTYDDEDAIAAVQEGATLACSRASQFNDGNIRAWLYRIVLNQAKNKNRRSFAQKRIAPDRWCELKYDVCEIPSTDGCSDEIIAAFQSLRPMFREVLLLKFKDLTYDEIAEILSIPKNTVGTRIYNARLAFKKKLARFGVTYSKDFF